MTAGNMFGSRPRQSLGQKLWRIPWTVVLLVALVAAAGTATLYSVAGGSLEPWASRHAARFLLGLGVALAIALVPLDVWLRLAYPAYALALALLLVVPLAGIEVLGARRWLGIGSFTLQPAEIMKVALVAALARYYQWLPWSRVSRPLWVALPLMMIAVPVVLTLKQPDLGTATLFAGVGLGLMMLAGVSALYALFGGVAAIALAPMVWTSLHAYQRRRIEIFLDPDKDPLGAGYHIAQSKIALGSGGLSGRGYIQGTQSQLDFVPEKHTDFIFTMFAEEWGFVGADRLDRGLRAPGVDAARHGPPLRQHIRAAVDCGLRAIAVRLCVHQHGDGHWAGPGRGRAVAAVLLRRDRHDDDDGRAWARDERTRPRQGSSASPASEPPVVARCRSFAAPG